MILLNTRFQIQQYALPPHKLLPHVGMEKIDAVIFSISRDAFNLGMAMQRLEDEHNNHCRHLLIDRDGKCYQFADLLQPLYHLPNYTVTQQLGNYNTVAVEIVSSGKIFYPDGKYLLLRQGEFQSRISRNNIRPVPSGRSTQYYETMYYQQYNTLRDIIIEFRSNFPHIALLNCDFWPELKRFALPAVFPLRRLNIE